MFMRHLAMDPQLHSIFMGVHIVRSTSYHQLGTFFRDRLQDVTTYAIRLLMMALGKFIPVSIVTPLSALHIAALKWCKEISFIGSL